MSNKFENKSQIMIRINSKSLDKNNMKNINKEIIEKLTENYLIKKKLLSTYEEWTRVLLTVINEKESTFNHIDTGTPIQTLLNSIENLYKENFELKKNIILQKEKNENLLKEYKINSWINNNILNEYNNLNIKQIKIEHSQIKENLQSLANELDNLNENKQKLEQIIKDKINFLNIYNCVKKREELLNKRTLFLKIKNQIIIPKKRKRSKTTI